jgi:hypothetical protein
MLPLPLPMLAIVLGRRGERVRVVEQGCAWLAIVRERDLRFHRTRFFVSILDLWHLFYARFY